MQRQCRSCYCKGWGVCVCDVSVGHTTVGVGGGGVCV